jgi:hypothetical protein
MTRVGVKGPSGEYEMSTPDVKSREHEGVLMTQPENEHASQRDADFVGPR